MNDSAHVQRLLRSLWFAVTAVATVTAATTAPAAAQADAALDRAKALMREVPLIDGHNDLPWEMRARWLSFDSVDIAHPTDMMTDIPRLRAGGVGAQFWSTYAPAELEHRGAGRIGMEEGDMPELAGLIARALRGEPEDVAADVTAFRQRFGKVRFTAA